MALYSLTFDDPTLAGGVVDLKCTNPYKTIDDSSNDATNLEYELLIADIELLEEAQSVTCRGMLPVTQVVR